MKDVFWISGNNHLNVAYANQTVIQAFLYVYNIMPLNYDRIVICYFYFYFFTSNKTVYYTNRYLYSMHATINIIL